MACSGAGPEPGSEGAEKIEAFASRLPQTVEAHASSDTGKPAFDSALASLGSELHSKSTIAAGYAEAQHKRSFVLGGAMTPAGLKVLETLEGARREGLDTAAYHVDRLKTLQSTLAQQSAALREKVGPRPELTGDQQAAIAEALAAGQTSDAELYAALKKALPGSPLAAWVSAVEEGLRASAEGQTQAEVLLADGALRYALDMRHFNVTDLPEAERGPKRKDGTHDTTEVVAGRQAGLLGQLLEADGAAGVGALMIGLRPPTPQYARLVELLARYEEIVLKGGWPTKFPKMKKPKKDDVTIYKAGFKYYPAGVVSQVKERLKGEGLYDGPIDNKWEPAFSDAVLKYRRSNQLVEKKWIDYQMVQAMKVTAPWRVAQVKTNLQRLREHRVWGDDYYVYVNLPEYFAELWDKGERKLRFKVIVGSRKKYRDKKTRLLKFPDRTPLLTDKFEKIIFNPDWMVPGRIRVQLKRQAKGDPNFWKDNGYEILAGGNGDLIRQKPGPNNALGRVKFLFPNDDNIYMHDTPKRALFNEEVRSFSHGCMRVHKPLEFAHYMLSREDKAWTERRVRINSKSGKKFNVELKDGPTIYIDYVTVKVDDEGEPIFMWDIYRQDIAEILEKYKVEAPAFDPYYP